MFGLSVDQIAAYAMYATLACTLAERAVEGVRWFVASTPSDSDDKAVAPYLAAADKALKHVHAALSFFSLRLGKK